VQWPKANQEGLPESNPLKSDGSQVVRQGRMGFAHNSQQTLKEVFNSRGTTRLESTVVRGFLW
jgi:hypothetical protein